MTSETEAPLSRRAWARVVRTPATIAVSIKAALAELLTLRIGGGVILVGVAGLVKVVP